MMPTTTPPSATAEQRARTLLNYIAILEHCGRLPRVRRSVQDRWSADAAEAGRELESIYAAGLPRDFLDRALTR